LTMPLSDAFTQFGIIEFELGSGGNFEAISKALFTTSVVLSLGQCDLTTIYGMYLPSFLIQF
jgi:hypothetical protein